MKALLFIKNICFVLMFLANKTLAMQVPSLSDFCGQVITDFTLIPECKKRLDTSKAITKNSSLFAFYRIEPYFQNLPMPLPSWIQGFQKKFFPKGRGICVKKNRKFKGKQASSIVILDPYHFALGFNDGTIKIFDALSNRVIMSFDSPNHNNSIIAMLFIEPSYLIYKKLDDSIETLDLNTKEKVKIAEHDEQIKNFEEGIDLVNVKAMSQKQVFLTSDFSIQIFDRHTDDYIAELVGHSARIDSLHFLEQHNYLVSSSRDGSIRVWNINNFSSIMTLNGYKHEKFIVKPLDQNQLILVFRDGIIEIVDLALDCSPLQLKLIRKLKSGFNNNKKIALSKDWEYIFYNLPIRWRERLEQVIEREE